MPRGNGAARNSQCSRLPNVLAAQPVSEPPLDSTACFPLTSSRHCGSMGAFLSSMRMRISAIGALHTTVASRFTRMPEAAVAVMQVESTPSGSPPPLNFSRLVSLLLIATSIRRPIDSDTEGTLGGGRVVSNDKTTVSYGASGTFSVSPGFSAVP